MLNSAQRIFKFLFTRHKTHKLNFRACKLDSGRDNFESRNFCVYNYFFGINTVDKHIVDAVLTCVFVNTNAACCIALWVDVNKKYALSLLCNAGSKINGGCCFADAAFLICDGYEFCHYEPPHMLF